MAPTSPINNFKKKEKKKGFENWIETVTSNFLVCRSFSKFRGGSKKRRNARLRRSTDVWKQEIHEKG
ncbi:hypothetical protein H5410_034566 [Solanum commersonii]|uniref:Uncharacterized protein n=1 Tax=Solanum commersonii TaxID=4109 RepID=A0A9J5YVV4_SOLCO|nr:hypothetical protein H5410_034566 [Solanum commersonii]